jgi:DNA-binding winged helix-turn-helix (wHTH) protein
MELIFNFNLRKTGKPYAIKTHFERKDDNIRLITVTRKGYQINHWLDVFGYTDALIGMIRQRLEDI